MSPNNPPAPPASPPSGIAGPVPRPHASRAGRVTALAGLTLRETIRSRALIGMTLLMILFGAGSLLWPADVDAERVILVQQRCFAALVFFGLIAAAFLAGSALPADITSKRIYSLITKPVSRFDILLGKTLGLLGVLFIFLALGGGITLAVSHVASARKSYAGGSYVVEVTADSAQINTKNGPVAVNQGQMFIADRKTEDGYEITLAQRDTSVSGVIPAKDVALRVRELQVKRVAGPAESRSTGVGEAQWRKVELALGASELAVGDLWTFSLPTDSIPAQAEIPVRMHFFGLLYETPALGPQRRLGRRADVALQFRNPVTGNEIRRDITFTVRNAPVPTDQAGAKDLPQFYEEVFALPREVLAAPRLEVRVADYTPTYRQTGPIYYDQYKSPLWRFSGFNPSHLPQGHQTICAEFSVHYTGGMDLLDSTTVQAILTNPATTEKLEMPVTLRNRTITNIRFPRHLVDDQMGVELTFTGLGRNHRIGTLSAEPPVYLILKPDLFWASTARSLLLIFLYLSIFTALAVAASSFLSSYVAIFLVLVFALAGVIKEFFIEASGDLVPPVAQAVANLQDQVGAWIKYVLLKALVFLAAGFDQFSSSDYVNRGWSVPWSAVGEGMLTALIYVVLFSVFGYVLFRAREFE